MKNRRHLRGGIALLFCVLLIGLTLPAWGETAGKLQKTDGAITYDAELSIPEGVTACPILPCERVTFAPEPFLAAVAPGTDPEQTAQDESNGTGGTFQYIEYRWPNANGNYSDDLGGNFAYASDRGACLNDLLVYFQSAQTDAYRFPNAELSFATQAQSVQKALALFASVGVNLTVDTVIPLDLAMLNQMQQATRKDMEADQAAGLKLHRMEEWREEDACYVILFKQEMEGLPLYDQPFWPYTGNGDSVDPPCAEVVLSAAGVESLQVNNLWKPTETPASVSILSLQEMLTLFGKNHNELLGAEPLHVSRIALTYAPVGIQGKPLNQAIQYVPAYVFTVTENGQTYDEGYSALDGACLQWN